MLAAETILQDRYRIVRAIGQGGMGAVYLAVDQRLGNTVALKQTLFEDDVRRRAFEREARLLASLRHPALPRVSDYFSEANGQFLVMEYIAGEDLSEMRERQPNGQFPLQDVLKWADQLLDALEYLHEHQPPVLHRDIKPQNLKLTSRGQIILLDFGLAKGSIGHTVSQHGTVHTATSIFGYTPNFAPLEQIQGMGTDPRSDLYALAATLYYLLTGARPPDALTRATAVVNNQPDPLRPANEIAPHVPPAVAAVLHQAMAQNREQRPASAAAMRQLLRAASKANLTASETERATVVPLTGVDKTSAPLQENAPTVQIANRASSEQATEMLPAATVNAAQTSTRLNTPTEMQEDSEANRNPVVVAIPSNGSTDAEPLSVATRVRADSRSKANNIAAAPVASSSATANRSRRAWIVGGVAAALVAGISFAAINASRSNNSANGNAPTVNAPAPVEQNRTRETEANVAPTNRTSEAEALKTETRKSEEARKSEAAKAASSEAANESEKSKATSEERARNAPAQRNIHDEEMDQPDSSARQRNRRRSASNTDAMDDQADETNNQRDQRANNRPQRAPVDEGDFDTEGSNGSANRARTVNQPPRDNSSQQPQNVPPWMRRMMRRARQQEQMRNKQVPIPQDTPPR